MNAMDRLIRIREKPTRRLIGLMSGMSMDGVDLADIEISGTFPSLQFQVHGTHFEPYSPKFKNELQEGVSASAERISRLNVQVGRLFSRCVNNYLEAQALSPQVIDAIGSHGQTLFHATDPQENLHSSLQIGFPSLIAQLTSIVTVGNFRLRDIAAGGQGAPLVCLADYIQFRTDSEPVAINNLGSISNVSVVTPRLEDMIAFDTGPANMAIDYFVKESQAHPSGLDLGGNLSSEGECILSLLDQLLNQDFFKHPPPKAAGYREFGPQRLKHLTSSYMNHPAKDLIRTGVEYAARTIHEAYENFVRPRFPTLNKVYFSGGGVHNKTLMRRISELMCDYEVHTFDNEFSDAKEAISFALLANETLCGRPGNIPGATGAKEPVVLGEVAF